MSGKSLLRGSSRPRSAARYADAGGLIALPELNVPAVLGNFLRMGKSRSRSTRSTSDPDAGSDAFGDLRLGGLARTHEPRLPCRLAR